MPPFVVAYAGAAITMLALDALWLTTMVPRLYQPQQAAYEARARNPSQAPGF